MKLIIQIPCYNEEETLPAVLADLPKSLPGIDEIQVVVIDDGSDDQTANLARMLGAYVVPHTGNKGLAAAFQTGLDACLTLGADIIVNTDGDHQYSGGDIPALIKPILDGDCDMVVGDRQTREVAHFSPMKKRLQAFGSWTMRRLSGTSIPDAPSGFRALSREAAMRLNVVTRYTYTLETIIQAGKKNLSVRSVPISTRPTRPSRLFPSVWSYVKRSAATMVRIWAMYEPLKTFSFFASLFLIIGMALVGRFFFFYIFIGEKGPRHIQSLIIALIFAMIGAVIFAVALLADLIANNRRLIEDNLYRTKKLQYMLTAQAARNGESPHSLLANLVEPDTYIGSESNDHGGGGL
ncbi:MAG: glycosyltransferase family 2 protein [Chloroflexota bacterium]|nr:glycosyltransferase family 2 protein [Chloroflexota bacterium]